MWKACSAFTFCVWITRTTSSSKVRSSSTSRCASKMLPSWAPIPSLTLRWTSRIWCRVCTSALSSRLISSASSGSVSWRRAIAGRVRPTTRILPRQTPADTGIPRKLFSPCGCNSGMDESYLNRAPLESNSWGNCLLTGPLFSFTMCAYCDSTAMKNQSANDRCGLLAGGNWIIDQVKMIDVYPQPEQLANIRRQSEGTGGAPYNVLVDLAKTGVPFPLFAAGLVGQDSLGEHIRNTCRQHKIDVRHLGATSQAPTSYTDVMTEQGHGRRTFFQIGRASC